jgi:hypothetical protein
MNIIIIIAIPIIAAMFLVSTAQTLREVVAEKSDDKNNSNDQVTAKKDEQNPDKDIDVPQLPIGQVIPGETASNTIKSTCGAN